MQLAVILRNFKNADGVINYPLVMQVPKEERFPAMALRDFEETLKIVIGAVTMAFKSMSIKKGLNELQVLDLSEAIIDTSHEDNLGVEDLILFLQGMVRGVYGSVDEMSIPKFMQLFEKYRQERHSNLLEYRENQHLQHKGLGDANRTKKEDPLAEHFSKMADTISGLRSVMRDIKSENHVLTQANKHFGEK